MPSRKLPDLSGRQQHNERAATLSYLRVDAWVLVLGVLPSLGKEAVVPVNVHGIVPQLALFDVLFDGIAPLLGGHLKLGRSLLGNLRHKGEGAVSRVERDAVPGRRLIAVALEEDAVLGGVGRALQGRMSGRRISGNAVLQVLAGTAGCLRRTSSFTP